jgi:hypothetical protein
MGWARLMAGSFGDAGYSLGGSRAVVAACSSATSQKLQSPRCTLGGVWLKTNDYVWLRDTPQESRRHAFREFAGKILLFLVQFKSGQGYASLELTKKFEYAYCTVILIKIL